MSATEEDILNYINSIEGDQYEKKNKSELGMLPLIKKEDQGEATLKEVETIDDSMTQPVFDIAQGMNDQFLNLLDIPNSVFDWAAEKLGSDLRVGSIRQLSAETIGVGTKEGRETSSYRAGEYLGMGLEFMAPILSIGKAAPIVEKIVFQGGKPIVSAQAPSTAKRVAQQINAPFVSSPKTAMAIEIASGLGSGYGSFYGEEEYGEIGAQVGGLGGGLFPALSTIPMLLIKNYAIKSIFPFTELGANAKGGEIIRQLRELPGIEEEIKRESERILKDTKFTSARMTKDPHLIALERVLIKDHPELEHQLRVIDAENNVISKVALRELGGEGAVEDSIKSLGSKYTQLKIRLDLRVDKALDNVKKKISTLMPKNKRQVVNIETNNQIKSALKDARESENIIWNEVDKTAIATTSNSKAALQKIYSEMEAESDKTLIPKFLNEFLGRMKSTGDFVGGEWGSTRHVGGIQQLRSRVLQEINNEKFGESVNWNRVRILEDLEEAMLVDMANSPASKSINDALEFSRELNKKFKGDIMSMILKNNRSGGSLAPELTLDSLGGGPKGAFYIKRILEASPESKGNIEDVLKMDMVQQKIFKEDGLNIQKAKDYMTHNEDTMKMFPALKDDMENAISIAEVHKYFEGSAKVRMDKAEKSLGFNLADKTQPGTFLSKILSSKEPIKSMVRVMRQMNDQGRAGVKADIVDMIFTNSKIPSELVGKAGEETPRLSGVKAVGFWNENKSVLSKAFSKDELGRLDIILNTLRLGDTPKNLPTGVAEKALIPKNTALSFAIVTMATRFGAGLGKGTSGASLRTASMTSKWAQKVLGNLDINAAKKLLIDSVQDKDLFIALSQDVTKVQLNKKAMGALQGWMLAHAVSRLEETREQ